MNMTLVVNNLFPRPKEWGIILNITKTDLEISLFNGTNKYKMDIQKLTKWSHVEVYKLLL